MDQLVVELGAGSTAAVGNEVVVFGAGDAGEPTAADWAGWSDTIGYEIVARIGSRVPRRHLGLNGSTSPAASVGPGGFVQPGGTGVG